MGEPPYAATRSLPCDTLHVAQYRKAPSYTCCEKQPRFRGIKLWDGLNYIDPTELCHRSGSDRPALAAKRTKPACRFGPSRGMKRSTGFSREADKTGLQTWFVLEQKAIDRNRTGINSLEGCGNIHYTTIAMCAYMYYIKCQVSTRSCRAMFVKRNSRRKKTERGDDSIEYCIFLRDRAIV
jgi:hypothetical protein